MAQLKNSTLSSGDIHSADTVISPGKCSPVLLLLINSFLYISVALYSPFLSAYYRQNGITSSQIGILMTVALWLLSSFNLSGQNAVMKVVKQKNTFVLSF